VGEGAEWQALAAHLDAAAREDPRARVVRTPSRLLDEPRLAHAGFATQKDHRRLPRDGSVERRRQRCQLGISADEDRADESASHRAHVPSLSSGCRSPRAQADPPVLLPRQGLIGNPVPSSSTDVAGGS
jgi:hypothetical protein